MNKQINKFIAKHKLNYEASVVFNEEEYEVLIKQGENEWWYLITNGQIMDSEESMFVNPMEPNGKDEAEWGLLYTYIMLTILNKQ